MADRTKHRAQPTSYTRRVARGQALRKEVPRAHQAAWSPPKNRPDPVQLIHAQDRERLADLVELRHQRMSASPFAFLRGAAVVMAHDLASTAVAGNRVEACGDCHLANFGLYGTPERNLIFDVNDFDETLPAPWEWDLKRLASSFVVAARSYHHPEEKAKQAARAAVESYRTRIREMGRWTNLEVWYCRVTAEEAYQTLALPKAEAEATIAKARAVVPAQELSKLTEVVNGQPRFKDDPPLLCHVPQSSSPASDSPESVGGMAVLLANYQASLEPDRRVLFGRYRLVDAVRKVVGVGSVGTRCATALLLGSSDADPLFLQVKEAQASVLEAAAGASLYANHAERVVNGQRLAQAASDLFLGWVRGRDGRDYYVRQLADMKRSVDTEVLAPGQLADYARACGWVLARAHARSGDAAVIGAYLGASDAFDNALVEFACRYADQTEKDFEKFVAAKRPKSTTTTR
ncbi:MAG TPA: DUF2252 domain-containing protein [Actinomycetota bacterium]|nr:DUF2252 domain-containing protein [Actinomycetota bacterium]